MVLFMLLSQDEMDKFSSYDERISKIARASPVPVYSFCEMYLGSGILGGYMTNGFSQGTAAAELAIRIMEGEDVEDIPIVV